MAHAGGLPVARAGFCEDTVMTTRTMGFPGFAACRMRGGRTATGRAAGFTLLELLVVMVIIGLLVGYVAPRYFQQVGKSEVKMAQAQVESLQKALDLYRLDTGQYPSTEQGLKALVERPPNETKWAGPYLKKGVPADPWGRAYIYRYPGEKSELDLYSLGKDGQPGGTGEAADITNR
jgi:general secretion pathway protein G